MSEEVSPEETIKALEERSGELKENLMTEATVLQRRLNDAIEYGTESRAYNLRRGEARRQIERIEDLYDEAKAVVALGDQIGLTEPERQRDEEVRLEKEKWYGCNLKNPYTGEVGEAVETHIERTRESINKEILSHSPPIQGLRNALKYYEILLYEIGEGIENLDPDTPFEPTNDDSEFVENSTDTVTNKPVDLTEVVFSNKSWTF